jgi:hypothetical protein
MSNVEMRPQTLKVVLVKTENRAYSENAKHEYRSLENEKWYDQKVREFFSIFHPFRISESSYSCNDGECRGFYTSFPLTQSERLEIFRRAAELHTWKLV